MMRRSALVASVGIAYVVAWVMVFSDHHLLWPVVGVLWFLLLATMLLLSIVFLLSQLLRRLDSIDAAWGVAFIVVAIGSFVLRDRQLGFTTPMVVTVLVSIWGLRLTYHIIRRLVRSSEDTRSAVYRKQWGKFVILRSFLQIYMVQAVLVIVASMAVIHINLFSDGDLSGWTFVGFAIWLVGFGFEAIGDAQLQNHIATGRKGLLTTGLWRYTRHPNYFGEATMWWGIFTLALGTPYGWLAIITPAIMTYLLLFVSGVPLTERLMANKPGWKQYAARTSKFLPLPPKKV